MVNWANPEIWTKLRDSIGSNTFIREPIMDGEHYTKCALGIDEDARLHLMVQVPDDNDILPPDLNDITIRYAEIDCLVVDVSVDGTCLATEARA